MSIEGEPFFYDIKYPPEMTKEFIFEVKRDLTKNELEEFIKICIEYEATHGGINPQDPNFAMSMERAF